MIIVSPPKVLILCFLVFLVQMVNPKVPNLGSIYATGRFQYAPVAIPVCSSMEVTRFGGKLYCHQSLLPLPSESASESAAIRIGVGYGGCLSDNQDAQDDLEYQDDLDYQDTQMPKWSAQQLLLEQCPRMGMLLEQQLGCPSCCHHVSFMLYSMLHSMMMYHQCPQGFIIGQVG